MRYVFMIGLIFLPLVLLLCAGWFFVRWQNEHENEKLKKHDKKVCLRLLIAAGVAVAIFLPLHLFFPILI